MQWDKKKYIKGMDRNRQEIKLFCLQMTWLYVENPKELINSWNW